MRMNVGKISHECHAKYGTEVLINLHTHKLTKYHATSQEWKLVLMIVFLLEPYE
jgi:hypothetical protein